MSYIELSDESKLEQAINFVARDQPLPPVLVSFLKENNLYEAIINPVKNASATNSQHQ